MKQSELENYLDPSLYRTLCLDKDASQEMIKKNYKAQAILWHPDKTEDEGKREHYMRVKTAYEVLSVPSLKLRYDAILEKYTEGLERQRLEEITRKRQEELRKKEAGGLGRTPKGPAVIKMQKPELTESQKNLMILMEQMKELLAYLKKNRN